MSDGHRSGLQLADWQNVVQKHYYYCNDFCQPNYLNFHWMNFHAVSEFESSFPLWL